MATAGEELKKKAQEHIVKQQYYEAVECYNKAIAIEPENHILYSNRSLAYYYDRRLGDAYLDALKVIQLQPDFFRGYIRKMKPLMEIYKRWDEVEEIIKTFKQKFAGSPDILKDFENGVEKEFRAKQKKRQDGMKFLEVCRQDMIRDDPNYSQFYYSSDDEDEKRESEAKETNTKDDLLQRSTSMMQKQMSRLSNPQAFDQEETLRKKPMLDRLQQYAKHDKETFCRKSYIVKIYMSYIHPRIWRRVRLPASTTLDVFHDKIIAPVMGWVRNYHGYLFYHVPQRKNEKGDAFAFGPSKSRAIDMMHLFSYDAIMIDSSIVCLGQLLQLEGEQLEYIYDLGDNFVHKILLEKIEDSTPDTEGVVELLDGERMCPPEDCGSISEYLKMLPKLRDKKHPEHLKTKYEVLRAANYSDAKDFDPDAFELKKFQKALQIAIHTKISSGDARNFMNLSLSTGVAHKPQFEETKVLKKVDKKCAVCGAKQNLKVCSQCKIVYYCSREHQLQDWKEHKKVCRKMTSNEKDAPIIE